MRATRDRGFALLVVLWSLVLISLLTMQILAAGRISVSLADNISAAAQAQARADGAINEAIFHLLATGPQHWQPDGALHVLVVDGGEIISVRIRPLTGKINPNLASAALLAGLFQASGATSAQAIQLADAVIQWRSLAVSKRSMQDTLATYQKAGLRFGPPAHPFNDLSELGAVLGMPPTLLAAALPHMSLYQTCAPDPTQADFVVRQALTLSGEPGSHGVASDTTLPLVSIEANVDGPRRLAVRRDAIVSVNGVLTPTPFQYLALNDGY
jgi:general secretion pathway protein K